MQDLSHPALPFDAPSPLAFLIRHPATRRMLGHSAKALSRSTDWLARPSDSSRPRGGQKSPLAILAASRCDAPLSSPAAAPEPSSIPFTSLLGTGIRYRCSWANHLPPASRFKSTSKSPPDRSSRNSTNHVASSGVNRFKTCRIEQQGVIRLRRTLGIPKVTPEKPVFPEFLQKSNEKVAWVFLFKKQNAYCCVKIKS